MRLAPLVLLAACTAATVTDDTGVTDTSTPTCETPDGAPQILAEAQDSPYLVAVDATHVYWASQNQGVSRVRKDGTGNESLNTGSDGGSGGYVMGGVAVDDTHVFYTDGGEIWRVPKEGGVAEQVGGPDGGAVREIAVDGTHVYWVDYYYGAVYRTEKDHGGGYVPPLVSNTPEATRLALDETHVYWTTERGKVYRAAKDGTGLALLGEGSEMGGVVVDAEHVFWVEHFGGRVTRANKDGSGQEVLVPQNASAGAPDPYDLTQDLDHLYWTTGSRGGYARLPKTGGEVAYVEPDGISSSRGIAVDDGAVFWVTGFSNGMVWKSCK